MNITSLSNQIRLALLFTIGFVAGCATEPQSSNPLQAPAYVAALEKQNQAVRSVMVYKAVPTDAIGVRPIMAGACGGNPKMTGVDEDYILKGLKLKAYNLSSDGVAEVDIRELPDPNGHCQGSIPIGGTAKAFTVRR